MKKQNLLLLGISIVLFLLVGVFAYNGKIEFETWLGSGVVIGSLVTNLAQMFKIQEKEQEVSKLKEDNKGLSKLVESYRTPVK